MWLWVWVSIWSRTLSPYYVLTIVFITVALLLSCLFTRHARKLIMQSKVDDEKQSCEDEDTTEVELSEDGEFKPGVDAFQSRIKVARHHAIIEHLSSNMTKEQLVEEKEVEKAQLAAILNLLKEQKDKFQVSDMQELEQQLSLYR